MSDPLAFVRRATPAPPKGVKLGMNLEAAESQGKLLAIEDSAPPGIPDLPPAAAPDEDDLTEQERVLRNLRRRLIADFDGTTETLAHDITVMGRLMGERNAVDRHVQSLECLVEGLVVRLGVPTRHRIEEKPLDGYTLRWACPRSLDTQDHWIAYITKEEVDLLLAEDKWPTRFRGKEHAGTLPELKRQVQQCREAEQRKKDEKAAETRSLLWTP